VAQSTSHITVQEVVVVVVIIIIIIIIIIKVNCAHTMESANVKVQNIFHG
jgi:hypothetical protein